MIGQGTGEAGGGREDVDQHGDEADQQHVENAAGATRGRNPAVL